MEQSQEISKPNKHIKTGVVVLIAIVAFLVGFGVFALFNLLSGKPSTPATTGDKPTAEQSTLSYETYKDFVRRTNIIVFFHNTTDQSIVSASPISTTLEGIANPNEEMKASFAYMYSNIELPSYDTWDRTTIEEGKAVHEALGHANYDVEPGSYEIYHNFDITPIQEAYKKLFGTELDMSAKAITLSETFLSCFVYLPSTKDLYGGLCGGGMGMDESYTYINDVVLDGDKIYTYFNFLNSDYTFGEWLSHDISSYVCYDNFDKQPTADCYKYFGTGITSFDYKDLHNYRLVFEKNADGDYVYKTAEKVK